MSKEHDNKHKLAVSKSEKPNELQNQNILSKKRKSAINFDDKKYAVKIPKRDQDFPNKKQESFRLRDFLNSIPVMGRFLVKIFTPEEETYKKLQSQVDYSSKAKDEASVDNKHIKEIDSKLDGGNVEQVNTKKKNLRPPAKRN